MPGMTRWVLLALVTSCLVLLLGETVFRKLDSQFAQEL
jgi:hypothetical protein